MKQITALNLLKTGQNVFLTGQAGAGKTYVLNQYISYLRARHIATAITASTGIASTHMNGMTIHAWSGMGIKDSFSSDDYARLRSRKSLIDRLKDTKVLIIDEISMLHAKQVDLLDEILRKVRETDTAFGGVQVIFSGDFFQLPPVGNKGESNKEKFAFMAKSWLSANFQVCYLSEQHRQNGEGENERFGISLNDILNQIRAQTVSQQAINALLATKNNSINQNRTRLYTHNASVDKINQQALDALSTPAYTFECTTFGEKALIDTLKKNVRASDSLTLKKGAKVMFVKNNPELGVSNGTMGEVVGFLNLPDELKDKTLSHSTPPIVRLNSGQTVVAEPEEWTIEDNQGEVLAGYSQIPLCLAWAITVHKSQGMTLDSAEIDLTATFETGQGYVALSRLKSLDGLQLLGMNHQSLLLDEWVFRVDKRLLELSAEHEANFATLSDKDVLSLHKQFISVCGGITDENIIAKNESQAKRPQIAPQSEPSLSTLEKTRLLVQEGLDLEEISQKRSLAKSTIIEHISRLIAKDGVSGYERFSPSQKVLDDIKTVMQQLSDKGELDDPPKLRPIVEALSTPYPYNTVRLALAFIGNTPKDNP